MKIGIFNVYDLIDFLRSQKLSIVRKNKTDSQPFLRLYGALSSILVMRSRFRESEILCHKAVVISKGDSGGGAPLLKILFIMGVQPPKFLY